MRHIEDQKYLQLMEMGRLPEIMREVADRLNYRIALDRNNLRPAELPVGGSEGMERISQYFFSLREGFRLNAQADQLSPLGIGQFLRDTDSSFPVDELLEDLGLFVALPPELQLLESELGHFRHFQATLAALSQEGRVTAENLEASPINLIEGRSFWYPPLSLDKLWRTTFELENTTNEMIHLPAELEEGKAFRALHFFVKGHQLAKQAFD